MPNPEEALRRKSLPRRVASWVAILIAVVFIYRVAAVYVVRPEACAPPERPARPLVDDSRDGREARYPPRSMETELTLMTYNIQGHGGLLNSNHMKEVAEVIRQVDADVVGLQEIHRGTWQSRFQDQAAELAKQTGRNVVFGRSFDSYGGSYGNAVLSRSRIPGSRVHHLPGRGEPRSLLEATVILNGAPVNVYVTHLTAWGRFQRASRAAQVACIAEIIERSEYPFVLLGDFNTTPGNSEITPLTASPLVRQAVNPSAATHILTQQHLDYIFPDSGWDVLHANVLTSGPSDHWPVVARLVTRIRSDTTQATDNLTSRQLDAAGQGDRK